MEWKEHGVALRTLAVEQVGWEAHPFDDAFAHKVLIDEALKLASHDLAPMLQQSSDDDKSVARPDHSSKTNVFEAGKSDDTFEKIVFLAVVPGHLRGGLAHDHAGHQGHSGHMTSRPELPCAEVLVPDHSMPFGILVADGRKLLHLEALRVVATNLFYVCDYAVEIVISEVENQRFLGHARLLYGLRVLE
jgi:hypothetical protein